MQEVEKKDQGIVVPMDRLPPQVLDQLIEEFVLREGTDYGVHEQSLEQKKKQIHQALKTQKIIIFFNPTSESTTLMTKEEFIKLDRKNLDILD